MKNNFIDSKNISTGDLFSQEQQSEESEFLGGLEDADIDSETLRSDSSQVDGVNLSASEEDVVMDFGLSEDAEDSETLHLESSDDDNVDLHCTLP